MACSSRKTETLPPPPLSTCRTRSKPTIFVMFAISAFPENVAPFPECSAQLVVCGIPACQGRVITATKQPIVCAKFASRTWSRSFMAATRRGKSLPSSATSFNFPSPTAVLPCLLYRYGARSTQKHTEPTLGEGTLEAKTKEGTRLAQLLVAAITPALGAKIVRAGANPKTAFRGDWVGSSRSDAETEGGHAPGPIWVPPGGVCGPQVGPIASAWVRRPVLLGGTFGSKKRVSLSLNFELQGGGLGRVPG